LIIFLVSGHLLAMAAACFGLAAGPAALVSTAMLLSMFAQLRPVLFRSDGAVTGIHVTADGSLSYRDPAGQWRTGTLARHVFARPGLTILSLTDEAARTHRAILLADSAGRDELRRLRIWLEWGHRSGQTGIPPG
jgi:hypothetical protein